MLMSMICSILSLNFVSFCSKIHIFYLNHLIFAILNTILIFFQKRSFKFSFSHLLRVLSRLLSHLCVGSSTITIDHALLHENTNDVIFTHFAISKSLGYLHPIALASITAIGCSHEALSCFVRSHLVFTTCVVFLNASSSYLQMTFSLSFVPW